jgi:hypothetical protein
MTATTAHFGKANRQAANAPIAPPMSNAAIINRVCSRGFNNDKTGKAAGREREIALIVLLPK